MAKRFYCILKDEREIRYDIEIWDSSFSGTALEFKAGPEGFDLDYSRNSERTAVFMPTACTVRMLMQNADDFALVTDLQGAAEGRFTIKITKGDTPVLYWAGMVLPDIGRYNEEYYPTQFEIRATDGLGLLKDVEFNDDGDAYTGKARMIEHITLCLNKLPYVATHFGGSDIFVKSHVDWWEETMADTSSDPDALYQAYLDHAVWWKYDKGEQKFLSCYQVLQNILTVLGCRITQAEGAFWIEQLTYRAAATIVTRRYSTAGALLSTANYAGYNDIAQTQDGALLAVGTYEFFPALTKAEHTFKSVERRNYLSGANINQATPTQTMYFPLKSNSGNTTMRLTGSLTGQVLNLTATPINIPVVVVFKIRLILDTVALKRAYFLKPTYQVDYSAMTWESGTQVCYFAVPMTGGIPPNGSPAVATFTQKIDLELPQLPEDVTQFIFGVEFDSFRKFDGTPYTAANYAFSWKVGDPWIEVYSDGNPVLTADETLYETYNTIQTTNSVLHESEALIGSSTDPNTIGSIWVKPSSTYVLADDWGEGTDTPDREVEKLLTEFVLSGQHAPLRRLQGTLFGDIVAMRRVLWDGVYWMLLGGTWSAGKNEFAGEWVEINYAPGLSASPPKRRRLTKIDPPVPPNPNTGLNGAAGIYEIAQKPPGTLLYPVAQTTTDDEVLAGAVTSIPVSTTLAAGDFYAGDTISIVNPITGNFESLTVTTTSLAGDTAIAVSGTLLHDYIENAPIIKKPLIGTFSLPAGATGQVLRHDGTKWVPYGTTALADGLVLTWNDATGWTAQATGNVTGTGTANYLPKWTGASALGNSVAYEDAGKIGVGTATPYARIHSIGSIGAYVTAGSDGASLYLGDANYDSPGYWDKAPGLSALYDSGVGVASDLGFYTYNGSRVLRALLTSAGRFGVGVSTPTEILHVAGNVRFSGALMPNNSAGTAGYTLFSAGSGAPPTWGFTAKFYQFSLSVPTVSGDALAFAQVTNTDFSANIEIWITINDGGYAQSKRYFSPLQYGGTSGNWHKCLPMASSGPYDGNDIDLDVNISAAVATFRVRRTAGTTSGTADITVLVGGEVTGTSVTSVSTSYTGQTVSTNYAPTPMTLIGGAVGVGTDSPAQTFHVVGAARITGSSGTATTILGRNASGDLSVYTIVVADIPNLPASIITSGILPMSVGGTGTGTAGTAGHLARMNGAGNALEFFAAPYLTGNQTITLSGDVTGSGATSITTTIANNAVTLAKMATMATASFLGRNTAGTGNVEVLSVATVKTLLNLAGTNSGDQTITLTGDVTGSGTGSFAATIANNAVTLAKFQQIATASFLGRNTAGTGNVEVLSVATVRTMLGYLSGTLTAFRIPFSLGGNDLGDDDMLTWDPTNNRLSVGNTGGSPVASVHIADGTVSASEPLRADGTVSGNMIVTMWNKHNSGGASNLILDLIAGGSSGGDVMLRWLVNGVLTWSAGIDNDDGDKWKLKPRTTPSTGSNQGITITANNPSEVGINKDSPAHPLDVEGRARATMLVAVNGTFGTTFGAGAGTSPSLTTLQGSSNGFVLAFSTGTTPTANANIITITLPLGFPSAMYPVPGAANDQTAADFTKFYIDSAGTSVLVLRARGTLSASTAYKLYFNISGI